MGSEFSGKRPHRVEVRVRRLAHGRGLPLPAYQTSGSAGMDLVAAVPVRTPVRIPAGGRALIATGLVLELPESYEAQVRPRSGLAVRHGLTVLNSPGTIDSDYRGEVKVLLANLGSEPVAIARGERIAQLVVMPVVNAVLVTASRLATTRRGDGGFGSTGTRTGRSSKPAAKGKPRAPASKKSLPLRTTGKAAKRKSFAKARKSKRGR